MPTVLLTGFRPFAGAGANPSRDAVRLVAERWDGPETLAVRILPVEFGAAAAELRAAIAAERPDVVLCTGLAGGRSAISVERVAINLLDAPIPDEGGAQPVDEPSAAGAAAAAFSTLPVKAIAAAIRAAGVPAEVSHTAGTFVCNHVFFTALGAAPAGAAAGFIHVPWADGQAAGSPTLPLVDIAEAVEIAIRTTLGVASDLRVTAGAVH